MDEKSWKILKLIKVTGESPGRFLNSIKYLEMLSESYRTCKKTLSEIQKDSSFSAISFIKLKVFSIRIWKRFS